MKITIKNYIGGKWIASKSRQTLPSINPANTKDVICDAPRSNAKDVDLAVHSARSALAGWKATPAPKRAEILYQAAHLIKQRKADIGHLVTREMGKVLKEGLGDVQEAIDLGYYMAGEGRRLFGDTVPSELPNKDIKTIRQPVGVFALITPWNFPTAIPAWKIFPCLVAGNTAVFKPSRYVPCSATKLIECFVDAGLPAGVLNLVHGTGSEIGSYLVQHNGIDAVSFTGSTVVGKSIGEFCGKNIKTHSLEMGGKNPIIIMDDADLALAVEGSIWAAFGTTGQRCTAASRLIIHEKVYNKFRDKFIESAKKLRLGDGLKSTTDVGPLINQDQLHKVEAYVQIGKNKDKAKLLLGGDRPKTTTTKNGYFLNPTIFGDVTPGMHIAQEEIFGPIVSLIKTKNLTEAIHIANSIDYGLSSAIFTRSVNSAHIAGRDLESGVVYINTSTIGAEIQTPFGGLKGTGNGHREAGGQGGALETYTEIKVINTDYSGSIQKAQID